MVRRSLTNWLAHNQSLLLAGIGKSFQCKWLQLAGNVQYYYYSRVAHSCIVGNTHTHTIGFTTAVSRSLQASDLFVRAAYRK